MSKRNQKKKEYLNGLSSSNYQFEEEKRLVKFNFKYYRFDTSECNSFEEWQKDKILADLNNKLKNFSGKTKEDLKSDGSLEIYNGYPKGSRFDHPTDIQDDFVWWARLRLTGKRRLIGFFRKTDDEIEKSVFYIVFLDKNHEFAPSNKKHT